LLRRRAAVLTGPHRRWLGFTRRHDFDPCVAHGVQNTSSRRYEPPRCPHAPRLTPHPSPKRAGAWPQPCMCTRGLTVPARRSTLVTRGAARSVAATHTSVPAQETLARRPVPNVLIARLRRRPRARTAQELPSSRYGSHAARRPATRQETTTTRLDVAKHHRKETKGEKREEGPRCPRWGDGVAVAGLSVAWRRCSGREGVPAR
jgi:hypothetical protein